MPLPVVLGPAAAGAVSTSLVAAKHAAFHAVAALDAGTVSSLSSASLATVLARLAWKRVPEWIKEDVSLRSLLPRQNLDYDVEERELTHLSSVIEKLQALVVSGSAKLNEPVPHLRASVLAYIQLSAQLQKKYPNDRDEWYARSGRTATVQDVDENLKDYLDFATWAYDEDMDILRDKLEEIDFFLLKHSLATRPGHVGYYVAVSPEQKTLLIGIKGTSTLEDLLTDCCGRAVSYNDVYDDDDFDADARIEVRAAGPNQIDFGEYGIIEVMSGHERIWMEQGPQNDEPEKLIRCHEGILVSAKRLAKAVQPTVEHLVVKCGYQLIICGHSLGAGASALLAVLLRSRIPVLMNNPNAIRVFAFAPPTVLDHDASVAASSFCTSIVNNADIIPRSSLANLAVFLEFLRSVTERLQEKGMSPTGPRSTAAFIRKLAQGTDGDDLLMTLQEVREAMVAAHDKVELRHPDHLYVPGRVLLMSENWEKFVVSIGDEEGNVTDMKDHLQCIVSDGSANPLRFFEFNGLRMFSDHLTSSYYASVEDLESKYYDS